MSQTLPVRKVYESRLIIRKTTYTYIARNVTANPVVIRIFVGQSKT